MLAILDDGGDERLDLSECRVLYEPPNSSGSVRMTRFLLHIAALKLTIVLKRWI